MAVLGGGGGQRNVLWQGGCGRRLRRRAAEAWLWQVVAVAEQDLMVSIPYYTIAILCCSLLYYTMIINIIHIIIVIIIIANRQ